MDDYIHPTLFGECNYLSMSMKEVPGLHHQHLPQCQWSNSGVYCKKTSNIHYELVTYIYIYIYNHNQTVRIFHGIYIYTYQNRERITCIHKRTWWQKHVSRAMICNYISILLWVVIIYACHIYVLRAAALVIWRYVYLYQPFSVSTYISTITPVGKYGTHIT